MKKPMDINFGNAPEYLTASSGYDDNEVGGAKRKP